MNITDKDILWTDVEFKIWKMTEVLNIIDKWIT